MSEIGLRKDQTCLNCGSAVTLRYCSVCGQENIEPHDNFVGMVTHFLEDLFHFDSKFFTTTKYLFLRPGFLSIEYSAGKRASYFHPIRMYLFTSALFFFIFFAFFAPGEIKEVSSHPSAPKGVHQKIDNRNYAPENGESIWFFESLRKKMLEIASADNSDHLVSGIIDKFLHKLPYLLFLSLPLYAFYLSLIYRRLKLVFYSDHGVFLIHIYIFTFILLLLMMFLLLLLPRLGLDIAWLIFYGLSLYASVYVYLAMLRFYRQNWFKTLLKFMLFNMLSLVSLMVLFGLFFTTILLLT